METYSPVEAVPNAALRPGDDGVTAVFLEVTAMPGWRGTAPLEGGIEGWGIILRGRGKGVYFKWNCRRPIIVLHVVILHARRRDVEDSVGVVDEF